MTKTYDVVGGEPVEDLAILSRDELLARKRATEARLGEINRSGFGEVFQAPEIRRERERLKAVNEAIGRRLAELREQQKAENARRTMAGLGSPLWDACVATLGADELFALERDALARFDARVAKKKLDQKNV